MLLDASNTAPENWARHTIGSVCSRVTSGGTPSRIKPTYFGGTIPWVKTKELNDGWIDLTEEYITELAVKESSAKFLKKNSVLMAMYGATVGKLGILRNDATCNQACCVMEVDESRADFRYLFYQLLLHRNQIERLATGAAQQNISGSTIKSLTLPFPSLAEQTKIGDIFSSLDNKIELNRRINQTLEQMAQALFQSWFVDFDPVKAKIAARAEGRDPLRAAMSAISGKPDAELDALPREQFHPLAATAALFPEALEPSELGEIPAGWKAERLAAHLTVLETGRRPKGGVGAFTEGIPSVGAENILGVGNYDFSKTKYVPTEFFATMRSGHVESYDVLLYKDGGKPGDFKPRVSLFGEGFPFEQFVINEHVFRLRSETLGQPFLHFQIAHERVLAELRHRGAKAAIPGINQGDVNSLLVLVPPPGVLEEFNTLVGCHLESILRRANESRNLAILRDALLPKLLSGELSVAAAEDIVFEIHAAEPPFGDKVSGVTAAVAVR